MGPTIIREGRWQRFKGICQGSAAAHLGARWDSIRLNVTFYKLVSCESMPCHPSHAQPEADLKIDSVGRVVTRQKPLTMSCSNAIGHMLEG
ncbi:growth differentiation factor 9-like protein [Lasius niger]|uniref:Growth differentiation factor 9-like protein n=1 Tax=Lasius niger TaxID=67767 RepID=A0A0J7KPD3_LASNI|nr:growth differentiation factor 9-like protein [Lasius niger]